MRELLGKLGPELQLYNWTQEFMVQFLQLPMAIAKRLLSVASHVSFTQGGVQHALKDTTLPPFSSHEETQHTSLPFLKITISF